MPILQLMGVYLLPCSMYRQNILLDRALNPVVADFGFVAAMPPSVGSTTVVTAAGAALLALSRGYHAPEVADGKHGAASDAYSYGVISRYSHHMYMQHVLSLLTLYCQLLHLNRSCWRPSQVSLRMLKTVRMKSWWVYNIYNYIYINIVAVCVVHYD